MSMMYESGWVKEFDKAGFPTHRIHPSWNDFLKWLHEHAYEVSPCNNDVGKRIHSAGMKPINKNDGENDELAKNLIKYPDNF